MDTPRVLRVAFQQQLSDVNYSMVDQVNDAVEKHALRADLYCEVCCGGCEVLRGPRTANGIVELRTSVTRCNDDWVTIVTPYLLEQFCQLEKVGFVFYWEVVTDVPLFGCCRSEELLFAEVCCQFHFFGLLDCGSISRCRTRSRCM